jgi:nucleoside-diphosphate-sugar epimerase
VSDIVEGMILAAEKIVDGSSVNLGTTERITVKEAAEKACKCFDHHPKFKFLPDMPTGPLNRVADIKLAKDVLGWSPQVPFDEGLIRTAEWYLNGRNVEEVKAQLATKLMDR